METTPGMRAQLIAYLLTIQSLTDIQTDTGSSGAPLSKRARTQHSTSDSQWSGSGAKNKFTSSNLPVGSTNNNIWRRVFVSTLTHFTASSHGNPWNILGDEFKTALQLIWDAVYTGKNSIKHTIVVGGPVYYSVSLSNVLARTFELHGIFPHS